jgi:hypothetical protein
MGFGLVIGFIKLLKNLWLHFKNPYHTQMSVLTHSLHCATIAADPCQRNHSRVRVLWDSWPNFTVSGLRLPFLSPPTSHRAMVEVFDLASTQRFLFSLTGSLPYIISPHRPCRKHRFPLLLHCCIRVSWGNHVITTEQLPSNSRCLQSHYLATACCIVAYYTIII